MPALGACRAGGFLSAHGTYPAAAFRASLVHVLQEGFMAELGKILQEGCMSAQSASRVCMGADALCRPQHASCTPAFVLTFP
jgi:hypothetical protein